MESHDEDRLMYRNLNFGNQITGYSTRDTLTALKRMGEVAAFWAMVPGPKMLWQFGELGFPFSINTCTNGTVNDNCRLDNKVPVWDFYNNPNKKGLFDVYANLLKLRMNPSFLSTFTTNQYTYNFSGAVKTLQINDDSLKLVVVGNFDLTPKTATLNFPSNGTWFSYLTKTSINVSGLSANVNLQPGEYHVYTNKDLSNSIVTSLFNPTNNTLSGEFKLYPNPVDKTLNILLSGSIEKELRYEIRDAFGRLIQDEVLSADKVQVINVDKLTEGMYFINLIQGDEIKSLKFIKN
jgi:hypothetical protein